MLNATDPVDELIQRISTKSVGNAVELKKASQGNANEEKHFGKRPKHVP